MADHPSEGDALKPKGLRALAEELKDLRDTLRLGGGGRKIQRQHDQGKLTARERVRLLLDEESTWVEIGLLMAHDRYDGEAPGAGVVTGVGMVEGREVVVVANDATVKAGSWWPETIKKMLRAQEVAMRCRIPIIYLVDSSGVNLPYQGGVFPGQYGAARLFYYNSIMRRYLGIPQIAAVMGPCIAGGAYLPALSDVMLMVEGSSFMGLGGPNLVKGATGQSVGSEELGGARVHTEVSGVAHYMVPDDESCVAQIRQLIRELPAINGERVGTDGDREDVTPPIRPATEIYEILPDDHRQPYDMYQFLECVLDGEGLHEFQPGHAAEMICGTGFISGMPVGIIANYRGMVKDQRAGPPRFGGIVYTESARKVAYFIETMNRHRTPLLFVQDVSGFMVGPDAEHSGIIRAGAEFVEAMSVATVPKLTLTVNHASGAGYYAMAGQGFDPDFILSLPTGRMGVMEGESAVMALFSAQLDTLKAEGKVPDEDLRTRMDEVREDYERQLDARFAAARGYVDEVVLPEELRPALTLLLQAARQNPGPHVGPFHLPYDPTEGPRAPKVSRAEDDS
jgi:acetyl-CoA carboxylase carboxyltransferase component